MKDSYRLGLVSVSFRDKKPEEILKAMQSCSLSQIEWGSDVHAPHNDIEALSKIALLQKEYGITCSSYGTYFCLGETPLDELPAYIHAAKILGTNILRLWCGKKSGRDMTNTEKEMLLSEAKKAAEIAKSQDVLLCMECHKDTFMQYPEDALWLIEAVGSPHFKMYWQPFQWQSENENLMYAESLSEHVIHLHVFQWKDTARFPLDSGIDEWRLYLKKFSTPRTLLLEFMPDNRIESLKNESNALRKIIGGTI